MADDQDTIDDGVDVEIEAETEAEAEAPAEKQTRLAREPEEEEAGGDEELESYSKNVQNRIKKLTEKYRKEERDREEATRIAQQLMQENQQLKTRMQSLDRGYLTEYGSRLDAQIAAVKKQYRDAYDAGDADKMIEAQEMLSKISVEQERLRIAKQRSEQMQAAPQQVPQQVYQAPQQQAAKPDPKAQKWAEKNEWFGTDEVMTYAAFGIHRKLVEEEGFDPASDEYYTEVDRRMRSEFPNKFAAKKSGGAQVASAGASASRSTAKQGRRSVKLSPSQIAMAKRLNVPLEEYAKYVKE
jgi:hypothetical protein